MLLSKLSSQVKAFGVCVGNLASFHRRAQKGRVDIRTVTDQVNPAFSRPDRYVIHFTISGSPPDSGAGGSLVVPLALQCSSFSAHATAVPAEFSQGYERAERGRCSSCNTPADTKCGACSTWRCCSTARQRKDWPKHKDFCRQFCASVQRLGS